MWTPKRIVLLLVGFVLFLTAYSFYARYLGSIDGLPMLPPGYLDEVADKPVQLPPIEIKTTDLDQRLEQAFGPNCPELSSAIKFQIKPKGMVLAAGGFQIEPDGRVRLSPLSVAIFKTSTANDGRYPDISTVRSHVAFLTFDQPITNPADLNKHRIIAGELVGSVTIANNRRTPQIDDDLSVFTHGPMIYSDEDHRVYTNAPIQLEDRQSKPSPTRITAVGMDLFLIVEDSSTRKTGKDRDRSDGLPKQPTVTGVERIVLRQDVRMDIWTDSGLLGPNRDLKAAVTDKPKDAPQKQKSLVIIQTQGPFHYDAVRYRAVFNMSERPGPFPNRVVVSRFSSQDQTRSDDLDCEKLELQFRPREEDDSVIPVTKSKDEQARDLEIESAHATGDLVILKSDAESLEAHGNDFLYQAKTRTTTFKGEPGMWAVKEGNELHCRELILVDPKDKSQQQATAVGPGRISLLDKQTGTRPRHAQWKDRLIFQKDGDQDLLVLTREALFRDDDHGQLLQADTIKVWIRSEAGDKAEVKARPTTVTETGALDGSRQPSRLEAVGHVQARAPELNIPQTERLVIHFKDVAPDDPALPRADSKLSTSLTPQSAASQRPTTLPAATDVKPNPAAAAAAPSKPAAPAGQPAVAKPTRPLDLQARFIEVHVLRAGSRNELHRVFTEGAVRVRQQGETPEDRGIDIRGEKLKVTCKPEGNLLEVSDEQDLAQLRMNKLYIVGPVVRIDQADNKAWVNGDGLMEMESNLNFQGGKLNKAVPMRVYWKKTMYFDGQFADFRGGVQAEQDNAVLLCQAMQVFLDRPVSLKEGDKSGNGAPARVRKLSCDQSVRIEDKTFENGKLVKYQRIECPEVSVDNEEGQVLAPGPGVIRILQPGSSETQLSPTPQTSRPNQGRVVLVAHQSGETKKEDELKLTKITYTGRMYANNKKHTAIFTDNVEVVNVPSEDPNADPNIDKLPAGGFYLRCDRLEVYSRQAEGKSSNELLARGHITFKAQDCYGLSDTVTYHEGKDQVILEGNPARLYRMKLHGGNQEELRAKKIIYLRKTGEFHIIQGEGVQGQTQ